MKGFKRSKVHSDESETAAEAVKDYVLRTPEFQDVMRFVGQGSSRITFALQDGSALKFAYNGAGVAQNKKEASVMQVDGGRGLPCFPKVYDHTDDWRGMLVECCSPMSVEDVEVYSPLGEFYSFTTAIHFLVTEKRRFFNENSLKLKNGVTRIEIGKFLSENIEGEDRYADVYMKFMDRLLDDQGYQWNSLRALMGVLFRFGDSQVLADLDNIDNWGLVIDRENGNVLPVVVDMGFDRDIAKRFYWRD